MKKIKYIAFFVLAVPIGLVTAINMDSFVYKKNSGFAKGLGYYDYNIETDGELTVIKNLINKGDIVFDVGANIGDWTDHVLKYHEALKVFAFEPIPTLIKPLKERFEARAVDIFELAIFSSETVAEFDFYEKSSVLSGIYHRPIVEEISHSKPQKILVKTVTLDKFCEEYKIEHINFLKIDTEGCEFDVLSGAVKLLEKNKIDFVQFEYGGCYLDSNKTLRWVYDLLTKLNYYVFRIYSQGLIYIPEWEESLENYVLSNYLAVSKKLFSSPCKEMPIFLRDDYTMSDQVPVSSNYRDDSYHSDNPIIYTEDRINFFVNEARLKNVQYYGVTDIYLYIAIEEYIDHIKDKSVAILGSVIPWYESIIISYGGLPTTIEYNKIVSQDSRLKVMTVDEYDKSPSTFDAVVSISSFEHDGLGRYGDPLDPYGDIKAMQKAKTMLKKEGLLFLAVPIAKDALVWNLHRIYGRLRLPLLIEGWDVVGAFGFYEEDLQRNDLSGFYQPVLVLRPQ